MKKVMIILAGIFLTCFSAKANTMLSENTSASYNYGQRYIFVEGGVEFSIFPDGQFDFVYLGHRRGNRLSLQIGTPNVNISFNAGYNYDMYLQYDMYGAVIQIENVPIYYDIYGRIVQAGNVHIYYNDWYVARIGGLFVHYNRNGHFSHYTGYINNWNRHYVVRPWHQYYVRPVYKHCIVYDYPYRRYYNPVRYSYAHHVKYYKRPKKAKHYNGRRDFYRPGSRVHQKNGRIVLNEDFDGDFDNNYHPRNRRTSYNRNDRRSGDEAGYSRRERGNFDRDDNESERRARVVDKKELVKNRSTRSSRTRSNATRHDDNQRGESRSIQRTRNDNRQTVQRSAPERNTRVVANRSERVSGNRNHSKQRANKVRSGSVKRKAASTREHVKRAAPSSKKSKADGRNRSSRGNRR